MTSILIDSCVKLGNCSVARLSDVPTFSLEDFRRVIFDTVAAGGRVASFFGLPIAEKELRIFALLVVGKGGELLFLSTTVGPSYPSLTPDCHQLHMFEREIAEQFNVTPQGHPDLKPVRFHRPHQSIGADPWGRDTNQVIEPAVMDFYRVEGDEIHEVAVGPVHAGVIEPGHFRFQCHGEKVFHLEISLGFQHRGVEKSLIDSPDKKRLYQIQTLSGDTTAGHTLAYCQVIEALSGCTVSLRSIALRRIALELERLACHTGDLGALAGDVGFLPTLSFCGRIRGDFLNSTALVCGNRFSRNLLLPGGVRYDLDKERSELLRSNLEKIGSDAIHATSMLWDTPSVMDRFERTGTVSQELATSIGLVGMAARACGLERDIRTEFPLEDPNAISIPISVESTGDVYARARIRFREIQTSLDFLQDQLKALPPGELYVRPKELAADAVAVSFSEGWRGEICHVAITDKAGKLIRYKIVDPSFHNWTGLAMALRNQEISDFPLCNKSFNLSYCGHDL